MDPLQLNTRFIALQMRFRSRSGSRPCEAHAKRGGRGDNMGGDGESSAPAGLAAAAFAAHGAAAIHSCYCWRPKTNLDRRNGLAAVALLHADVDLVALGAAEGERVVRGAAHAANVNVLRSH